MRLRAGRASMHYGTGAHHGRPLRVRACDRWGCPWALAGLFGSSVTLVPDAPRFLRFTFILSLRNGNLGCSVSAPNFGASRTLRDDAGVVVGCLAEPGFSPAVAYHMGFLGRGLFGEPSRFRLITRVRRGGNGHHQLRFVQGRGDAAPTYDRVARRDGLDTGCRRRVGWAEQKEQPLRPDKTASASEPSCLRVAGHAACPPAARLVFIGATATKAPAMLPAMRLGVVP
ncbi:hypothetical protein ABIB83_008734 [Bradyrhizobium sp. I1.8.5]